ncbi:hypothetical protein WN53_01220 [Serratia fonticola]|nr:hypothetical protein WN53_01220 [Serratia fonticola]
MQMEGMAPYWLQLSLQHLARMMRYIATLLGMVSGKVGSNCGMGILFQIRCKLVTQGLAHIPLLQ